MNNLNSEIKVINAVNSNFLPGTKNDRNNKGNDGSESTLDNLDLSKARFKRILFVVTDVSASYGKALNPHLGVAMLMAYLDKAGFETAVIDLQLGHNINDVVEKAHDFQADLIGFTMFSFDFVNTYRKINEIKAKTNLPIVLGGAHISTVKKEVLEKTNADFGIVRDGEIPLLNLCLGKPLEEIESLIWRNSDSSEIVQNPIMKLNWELDKLPFPAYEKFELKKYIHYIDRRLPLETSRGCPYSCTYCDVKQSLGQAFRPRSPEHVFAEMKYWYEKGFNYFEFVDDCFTMDLERARKVCELIIESDLKIRWNCANGIRADRVDEDLLRKMKQAGCEFVSYGLETGSPEMLKVIKKAITLDKARDTFELTKRIGLKFAVNFIIGHQEETYARAMESVKFAKSIPVDYVNFSNMIPYPGTEIFSWIQENEKTGEARFILPKEEFLKNSTTKLGNPVFETKSFSYKERLKALKFGRALAKKSHLQYRFGDIKGSLIYQVSRNNNIYNSLRRFVTGNKVGKKFYNVIKKSY